MYSIGECDSSRARRCRVRGCHASLINTFWTSCENDIFHRIFKVPYYSIFLVKMNFLMVLTTKFEIKDTIFNMVSLITTTNLL